MSADPLLEQLRASIPEGGKLTIQAFNAFLENALANADNYFNFNEVTGQVNRSYSSTIFYSGSLGPEAGNVYTGEIARDLANRSGGQVRVLDNTKIGRILIDITQRSGLSGFPIEGNLADFEDLAGKKFSPASSQFTSLTEGKVTTVIGRTASPGSVHADYGDSALNRNGNLRQQPFALGAGKLRETLLFPPFTHARKSEFLPPIQRDAIRPVPRAKINRFALTPNQHYNLRYPGPRRGALAIVTNVGAGCGGRGSVGRAGLIAGRLRL